MKHKLTIVLFFYATALISQTKIGSVDLELKKSSAYHQLYSAIDYSNNEFYILASDKDVVTVTKYNRALFYSGSLKTTTDKNYPLVVGNSFNHKNDLVLYWASENYKKFMAQTYNFNEDKKDTVHFEIPFKDELILTTLKENNKLYFLTYLKKQEKLKLYTLQGNKYDEKVLDFKSFNINRNSSKPVPAAKYIATNALEVIDNEYFNPLYTVTSRIKLYALSDKLLITLDYDSAKTHTLEIDWNTYETAEKFFPQPKLDKEDFNSNSFYHQDNLYQINANKNQLTVSKHDYNQIEVVQKHTVLAKEKIHFNNSPLYIQNGNYQPRQLKTTEKFLKRLKNKSVGISVYPLEGDLLVTLGASNSTITTDGIVLGTLLTISGIMIGDYADMSGFSSSEIMQNVDFECRFDDEFKPKSVPFGPLAIDFISEFLQENDKIKLYNTTKHKDYFILTYYDESVKQIVLRKFEDGYPQISDY